MDLASPYWTIQTCLTRSLHLIYKMRTSKTTNIGNIMDRKTQHIRTSNIWQQQQLAELLSNFEEILEVRLGTFKGFRGLLGLEGGGQAILWTGVQHHVGVYKRIQASSPENGQFRHPGVDVWWHSMDISHIQGSKKGGQIRIMSNWCQLNLAINSSP